MFVDPGQAAMMRSGWTTADAAAPAGSAGPGGKGGPVQAAGGADSGGASGSSRKPGGFKGRSGRGKPGSPQAKLQREGAAAVLSLAGDWCAPSLPEPPGNAGLVGLAQFDVDGQALQRSDVRLAAWLWPVLRAAADGGAEVRMQALPESSRAGLAMALAQTAELQPAVAAAGGVDAGNSGHAGATADAGHAGDATAGTAGAAAVTGRAGLAGNARNAENAKDAKDAKDSDHAAHAAQAAQAAQADHASKGPALAARPGAASVAPWLAWLAGIGQAWSAALVQRQRSVAFVGQVVLSATASLGRSVQPGLRSRLRLADVAFQFEQAGPRSLPIVLLVSALVGLIVAYMGGAQLELFGAQSFVAPLVAVGEVREIAALVVAVVLSGRVGAAYAAQLATMRGSEEIDALRSMGVDPVDHLVLPRLLALLVAAPLLTVLAAAGGGLAGAAVAVGIYGVAPREYLARSLDVLSFTHVAIGLFKGLLYGLLVGLAGCNQGLHAERSAQGVGRATTDAVVQAIVWVSVAAAVTTVVCQQLGW